MQFLGLKMPPKIIELEWDGHVRRALLHGDSTGPMVMMLHGTGGTGAFAADETRLGEFAQQNGFLAVFPDGMPVDPTLPPKFLSNPARWNDGSTRPGTELHSNTDDVGFLAELTRSLNPSRAYLTGFSNGAGMAFRLAAECPGLFAAVAPIAGYCHVSPNRMEPPIPTLFILGAADLLIPQFGGEVRLPWGNRIVERPPISRTLERWATALGCSTEAEIISDEFGIQESLFPGPVEFRSLSISGLGHHWPGGKGQFNPRIGGPVVDRLDANRTIWEFFELHKSRSKSGQRL